MVGEFPELQGVMGGYYARADGEDPAVAAATGEHYAPQGPSDACPTAPVSVAVALADKIDTLTGFFAIDEKPTGSRDPYALRRAALGVIRLILENGLRQSLKSCVRRSLLAYIAMPHVLDLREWFTDWQKDGTPSASYLAFAELRIKINSFALGRIIDPHDFLGELAESAASVPPSNFEMRYEEIIANMKRILFVSKYILVSEPEFRID